MHSESIVFLTFVLPWKIKFVLKVGFNFKIIYKSTKNWLHHCFCTNWDIEDKVNETQTKIDENQNQLIKKQKEYNDDCILQNNTTSTKCKEIQKSVNETRSKILILKTEKENLETKKQTIQTNRKNYFDHYLYLYPSTTTQKIYFRLFKIHFEHFVHSNFEFVLKSVSKFPQLTFECSFHSQDKFGSVWD